VIRVITDVGGMMTMRENQNIKDKKLSVMTVYPSQISQTILVINPSLCDEKTVTNHELHHVLHYIIKNKRTIHVPL
jgi:hypothetical protein